MLASKVRLAYRAVRHKLRLLTAYDTFWPAAVRGGSLLVRGQVGEFTRKLFNELPDAREADHRAAARTGPPLFLAGQILGLGGYDHLVLNVLKGLTESGVNVCRDRRACFRKQLVPFELRPAELRRKRHHPRLAVAPPHLLRRNRPDAHTVAFTMWETDTLPSDGVKQLNRCGLVIVPSTWGARCFRANGVVVPISVVPLGCDPAVFTRLAPPLPNEAGFISPFPLGEGGLGVRSSDSPRRGEGRNDMSVAFGTAGALDEGGMRKNVQRVIDLFRFAFPTQPDARLRVKITPNSPRVNIHNDSRIDVIDSHLSPAELAEWYRSLNAYVNASAGEGFGLHLLEAMACGVPLISTTFGGVGSFFDPRYGYEVSYRLVEARNAVYRGQWADPDDTDLMDRMWQVYEAPEQARQFGAAAAARALQFRWEDSIRKLVIVLIQNGFISARQPK